MRKANCGNCEAFNKTGTKRIAGRSSTVGECRSDPPIADMECVLGVWPVVNAVTGWCLRHQFNADVVVAGPLSVVKHMPRGPVKRKRNEGGKRV